MREDYGADRVAIVIESPEARAAAGIPDFDVPVMRSGRQPCRVMGVGYRMDRMIMPLEGLKAQAATRFPDLDNTIHRSRR